MLNWQEEYKRKTITAQQAANMIKNGDRIMSGNRDCRAIFNKLIERNDLEDVYYYAPIINYMPDFPAMGKGIKVGHSFLGDVTKQFYEEGRLDFIPSEYWLYDGVAASLGCTIAFVEMTKPDAHGYMSMSTCTDYIHQACKRADLIIVETNSKFPFIYGENMMHISEVDYVVDEGENYPLATSELDEDEENAATYRAVGGFLSELIEDEATIEVGLGRLNAASLLYLEPKRDLGVHTEIYGDILMRLTEKGVITNACKSMNRGKATFTQMVGSNDLFKWSEGNHGLSIRGCQEILNPSVIAHQHRMTAINNAVEIDLMGQANAEYLKGRQYSGMGGICNFASGATACVGGKSIVVLESATRNGKFSKIVPFFKPGTPISLPRTVIEYVVTEQGIAKLAGKSPADRARELINVAHPKFREELTFQAKEMGIL